MVSELLNPEFAAQVKLAADRIDQMDYFTLLNVPQDASFDEIRESYREMQQVYHPDRVFRAEDPELVDAVSRISKRLTEAYVTLKDARKRAKYLQDISGEERTAKLRFGSQAEQEIQREKLQVLPTNPQARTLYLKAKKAFENGDLAGAEKELKMAALFEPEGPAIKQLQEAIEAKKSG